MKKIPKVFLFIILIPITVSIAVVYGVLTVPILLIEGWKIIVLGKNE